METTWKYWKRSSCPCVGWTCRVCFSCLSQFIARHNRESTLYVYKCSFSGSLKSFLQSLPRKHLDLAPRTIFSPQKHKYAKPTPIMWSSEDIFGVSWTWWKGNSVKLVHKELGEPSWLSHLFALIVYFYLMSIFASSFVVKLGQNFLEIGSKINTWLRVEIINT